MNKMAVRLSWMLPLTAAAFVIIAGCGKKSPPVSIFPLVSKEDIQIGGNLFKNRCAICHGLPEKGNPPTFAPLVASQAVNGEPERLAATILYGKGHVAKPGDPHFFEAMDDASIARIGNYLKASAKATDIPMRAKTVEKVREIHKMEGVKPAPAPQTTPPDEESTPMPDDDPQAR